VVLRVISYEAARFFFDGGCNTMTEPDFCPDLLCHFAFWFLSCERTKDRPGDWSEKWGIGVPFFSRIEGDGQAVNVGGTERRPPG
jgi:hypothetical protein